MTSLLCLMSFRCAVPSSSSEDESTERIVSQTTQLLTTIEPIDVKEKRRFSETIAIEHKERAKQFAAPPRGGVKQPPTTPSKSELVVQQAPVPQGVKKQVHVPGGLPCANLC